MNDRQSAAGGHDTERRGGRPTMKDVASRAGVALKTVSRVVNSEPGVTPETARRVLGAIADLGFRRNESARLLRTGRTATLGFIAGAWTDPEHAAVYQGVEEVAGEHGYLLYTGSAGNDPEREQRLALSMCARRVDGLVIIPAPGPHDYLAAEIEAGVATVFALRAPSALEADVVLPDVRGGGRAATAHLIGHGHRRIGLVDGAGPAGDRAAELARGYREAMASAGLDVDESWPALTPGRLAAAEPPVTAVVCAGRAQTEATLRVLAARERDLGTGGRRLAVVGIGDLELADLVPPGITVVTYDPVMIGRTAAEVLIRRLAGEAGPPRRAEVPVRLVARGSAEIRPADG